MLHQSRGVGKPQGMPPLPSSFRHLPAKGLPLSPWLETRLLASCGSSRASASPTVPMLAPISRPARLSLPRYAPSWMPVALLHPTDGTRGHLRSCCPSEWWAPQWVGMCPHPSMFHVIHLMPQVHLKSMQTRLPQNITLPICLLGPLRNCKVRWPPLERSKRQWRQWGLPIIK